MPDRDKVIQHFKDAIEASGNNNKWRFVRLDIIEDAITMLKEQEDLGAELTNAVDLIHKKNDRIKELLKEQETYDTGESRIFQCEKCGYGIEDIFINNEHDYPIIPVYCPNCGRLVKQYE